VDHAVNSCIEKKKHSNKRSKKARISLSFVLFMNKVVACSGKTF